MYSLRFVVRLLNFYFTGCSTKTQKIQSFSPSDHIFDQSERTLIFAVLQPWYIRTPILALACGGLNLE